MSVLYLYKNIELKRGWAYNTSWACNTHYTVLTLPLTHIPGEVGHVHHHHTHFLGQKDNIIGTIFPFVHLRLQPEPWDGERERHVREERAIRKVSRISMPLPTNDAYICVMSSHKPIRIYMEGLILGFNTLYRLLWSVKG